MQFGVTFTGFRSRFVFNTISTPSRATAWLAVHRSTWSSYATPWMTFQQGATFGRRPRFSSWSLDIGRIAPVEEASLSPHHSCGTYFLPSSDFYTTTQNSLHATVHVMPLRIDVNSVISTTTSTTTLTAAARRMVWIVGGAPFVFHQRRRRRLWISGVRRRSSAFGGVRRRFAVFGGVRRRSMGFGLVPRRLVALSSVTRCVWLLKLKFKNFNFISNLFQMLCVISSCFHGKVALRSRQWRRQRFNITRS